MSLLLLCGVVAKRNYTLDDRRQNGPSVPAHQDTRCRPAARDDRLRRPTADGAGGRAQDLDAILVAVDARLSSSSDAPPALPADAQPTHRFYYRIKGQIYAMALILQAWSQDHPHALNALQAATARTQTQILLEKTASLRPWIVTTGRLDGLLIPNHVVAQGYLLHQARDTLATLRNNLTAPSRPTADTVATPAVSIRADGVPVRSP